MALQQAQLASLPSMNLARYVPSHTYIEPAWHKALSAFMSGAAGSVGTDAARNAMSRDVTPDAVRAGVASADSKSPSYLDQILHGPDWTQSRLQEAEKLQSTDNQRSISNAHMAAQLGLSQEQLDSLNKSRVDQLAARQQDQDNRDADRKATLEFRKEDAAEREADRADSTMNRSWDQEDKNTETQRQHDLQDQQHRDSLQERQDRLTEQKRIDDADIKLRNAQADPQFAGQKEAASMMAMKQMMDLYSKSPIAGAAQPSNNSDSDQIGLSNMIRQTATAGGPQPTNAQSVSPSPNQVTQPVGGAPDPLSAREAQNAGTTATQPGQLGQSTPTPPQNPYLKSFLDGAAAPGPYNVSPPHGASGAQPSTQFDPDMLKRAALFAQMMGSQGGIPGQGGMANV